MLRGDLQAASIPYRDAAGLVFDFPSLRCETATLADQAGVAHEGEMVVCSKTLYTPQVPRSGHAAPTPQD